jgi:hypothetical protein
VSAPALSVSLKPNTLTRGEARRLVFDVQTLTTAVAKSARCQAGPSKFALFPYRPREATAPPDSAQQTLLPAKVTTHTVC